MGAPSLLNKLFPAWYSKEETKSSDSIVVSESAKQILQYPVSTYISTSVPVWKNLSELIYLLDCYYENPVVQAVINIKAEAFANIRFKVKDLKTGEEIPLEDYDKDGGKLHNLIGQPNPLQSTYEWLRQMKVNYEVFGNAYVYASLPIGWENRFTYRDINVLNNLPPYCMTKVLTGKWLDATKKDEIIANYVFNGFNGNKKPINTNSILHLNNVNIKFDQSFTDGKSDLLALQKPISNIIYAYESRNVLIRKRGALGVLTSEKKDDVMGSLPMDDKEIKAVQDAFKNYGLLDDQFSHIISPMPLKYQRMAMSVKELMLFEEIEADAIAVAVAKGVPELLVKYYVKGGTFENMDASEKRLYDSTIIPESQDFMVGVNNFLKTKEMGIKLLGTYDHLNVLQENKKEEAETNSEKERTALSAFKIGAIVYDDYLNAIGMPSDPAIGSKRIWDLDEKQLAALKFNTVKDGNNN